VPIKALAKLVCGKFRAMLRRKCPDLVIPDTVWRTRWILHVTAWGIGEQAVVSAVLDYLSRYVFRVAVTNARIVGLDDQTVTIEYKERKTGRRRTCRLSGAEFMRRFLQHVLPRGFHKVRSFGLWHPAQRHNAARVRQMLQLQAPPRADQPPQPVVPPIEPGTKPRPLVEPQICPHCCRGRLVFIRTVPRHTPRQAMTP
jgi:Putative transposase